MPGTAFPAFIRAEFDASGNGFSEFQRQAESASSNVRKRFESDFDSLKGVLMDALSVPRNAAGSLDLGVDRYREAAAAAQATAIGMREVATAASTLARETGDTTNATRLYVTAARAAAVEAEHNAAQANALVVTQERLQEALNRTVSQTQAVVGASRVATGASGALTASAGAQRLAFLQAGQQAQDFFVQVQGGTAVTTALVQQGSQLAFVLSGAGGVVGRVASTLAGPWGLAVLGATAILGPYIGKLFETGDAADDATEALTRQRRATLDLIEAQRKALRTPGQQFDIDQNKVVGPLRAAQKAVTDQMAVLYRAEANIKAIRGGARIYDGTSGQFQTVGRAEQIAANIRQRLAPLQSNASALMQVRNEGLAGFAGNLFAERATPGGQADARFRTAKLRAQQEAARTGDYSKLRQTIDQLTAAHEAESKAASKASEASAKGGTARRAGTAADRDASAALKVLEANLTNIQRQFDPAATAAENLADQLKKIEELRSKGKITDDKATDYTTMARMASFDTAGSLAAQGAQWGRAIEEKAPDVAARLAQPISLELADAGTTIAQQMGFGGTEAARTVQQGMRLGAGEASTALAAAFHGKFSSLINTVPGAAKGYADFGDQLTRGLDKVFGADGSFGQTLGQMLAGAQLGKAVGKGVTNALGVGGSSTGASIGGALGSAVFKKLAPQAFKALGDFAGPLGSVAGSLLGSVLGGLFKKTSTGFAVVSNTGVSSGGKSGAASAAAGGNVQTGINAIIQQLGGQAGAYSVSIGKRGDYFRVSGSGATNLGDKKTSNISGLLYDGTDEAEATRIAILNAIEDGAVKGIKQGAQRLLAAGKDIDAGVAKAVKFQSVFDQLQQATDPAGYALEKLNKQFTDLRSIFDEAGASTAEYGQLQQLYGIQQKAAIDQVTQQLTGAYKSLLNDLLTGDNGLSLRDRLKNARATFDPLAADVAAGKTVDAGAFADAAKVVLDVSRQLYGSQDAYFGAFDQITGLAKTALSAQDALITAATNRDSPFTSTGAVANDNLPVVAAIDGQTDALIGALDRQFDVLNANVARLVGQGGASGGGNAGVGFNYQAANF